MHIPDGFIDLKTAVSTVVVSAGGLAAAIYKVKSYFKAKVIALMGIICALIFALQMINFPILFYCCGLMAFGGNCLFLCST